MWGNRFGWGISAGIFIAAMALAYSLYALVQPTPPTGELVAAVRPLTLGSAANDVLPKPSSADDAGRLYRDAIDDYRGHPADYDQLSRSRSYDPTAADRLAGLADLLGGADCPSMDLFRSRPDQIINYDPAVPDLDDLHTLATVAEHVAALATLDKDYPAARRYAAAVLAAGRHLFQERLTYGELAEGITLMGDGCAALQRVAAKANDTASANALAVFETARRAEVGTAVDPVWRMLTDQSDAALARHAGDYFQLAEDAAADRVWRVEAVRRIGRLQLNAALRADNVHATRYLHRLADEPSIDPVLHQAAVSARDITPRGNQSPR